MSFYLKVTAIGLAKIAAAQATPGAHVNLTQMALGDGNGNPVTAPVGTETALVREVYRSAINSLYINPSDSTIMMAELLVPSATGGFSIREIGVFDDTNALIAYGNFPETYKPIGTEGATRDMIVQAAVKVGTSSVVQLVIDTSIVGATRPWVIATITAAFLIPGGTTGQVLTKASNASGDVVWTNPTAALNIVVNAIKEIQTATASQNIFTLAVCTTTGVAVYVEGSREFDFTVLNSTQVQLVAGLPAGTRVMFVQNEPNEPINLRRLISGRGYFMGQL
jgi:phage-related tail fiber protein